MSDPSHGRGRYASSFGGLDALGILLTNNFLVTATCGIAWLLGVPSSRWTVFTTHHTTRDGQAFRYSSTWQEGLAHGVVNFFLRLFTLGLAAPWVFVRNERFRLAHTTTAEGHRMRFTGDGLDVAALRWFGPGLVLLTLGLAYPWLKVIELRWLAKNTVIEDPSVQGGSYTLRFDAGGIAYFVEFVVSVILTVLTFGIYAAWARASFARFAWSSTSDSTTPPLVVPSGPQTSAQWAVAIGAGTVAAAMAAALALAVVVGAASALGIGAWSTGASPASSAIDEPTTLDESFVPTADPEGRGYAGPPGSGAAEVVSGDLPSDEEVWLDAPCAPSAFTASRFLQVGPREAYPVDNAFDGDNDTAWAVRDAAPGSDWIEISLPAGTRVSRVWLTTGFEKVHRRSGDLFPLNAHLRRFTIVTDAGRRTVEVARDQRSADVRLNAVTGTLRIVADDVWPGERWQDLSISEIVVHCAR